MGPEGHPAFLGARSCRTAHQLQQEPVAQHEECRYPNPGYEDHQHHQHVDCDPRIQQHVRPHHTTYGTRCADHGNGARGLEQYLKSSRGQAAQYIEEDVADAAHRVLDIVSEDPEEPHVADEVEPAAVEEHRGERGVPDGIVGHHAPRAGADGYHRAVGDPSQQIPRNQSQPAHRGAHCRILTHPLHHKPHEEVGGYECKGGDRRRQGGVVISVGEHAERWAGPGVGARMSDGQTDRRIDG